MAGVSPHWPCWPFGPFKTQYLLVSFPCHLLLVPLSLLFGLLPLTQATVTISSFLTYFIQEHRHCPYAQHCLFVLHILLSPSVPLLLLLVENRCFKGEALPDFKALGTATVWRHCSMLQTGVMEASCIIHLCIQWPQPSVWLHKVIKSL